MKRFLKSINRIEILLLIPIIFIGMFFSVNFVEKTPNVKIELKGHNFEQVILNSDYKEKGFFIKNDNNLVKNNDYEYKITDNIDYNVVGDYVVNYDIKYLDNHYKIKRKISVIDKEKPVITTNQDKVMVYTCKNKTYDNLEYSAVDNYDGIITDKVSVNKGNSSYVLSVTDSSGNETSLELPIEIQEEKIPNIILEGKKIVYVKVGTKYIDEGANLDNGCGKTLENELVVDTNIDTSKPGEYYYSYKYNDGVNTITKTRKIYVYKEANDPVIGPNDKKIVYLTFDDGPGKYTEELLNILDKYNVKATFFVTNQFKRYVPLIKEEYLKGHRVAVHTYTHKWEIYQSVETYLKDFNDMNNILLRYTGSKSNIFRFPGGSSNTVSKKYSKGVVSAIKSRMSSLGNVYYDWNVDSEDAAFATREQIINNVINGINKKHNAVVLMHDIKRNTIDAIEDIIKYGLANGFTFAPLNANSLTVHHYINN